jgi:hypothetical protein
MPVEGKTMVCLVKQESAAFKPARFNTLSCKSIWYYSPSDELFFFEWLKRIPSIIKIEGLKDTLYLTVQSTELPDADLREIVALFYRYKVDMKQLAIFLTDTNKRWFYLKTAYWFRRTFGSTNKGKS